VETVVYEIIKTTEDTSVIRTLCYDCAVRWLDDYPNDVKFHVLAYTEANCHDCKGNRRHPS
jgi:hypothetical protein